MIAVKLTFSLQRILKPQIHPILGSVCPGPCVMYLRSEKRRVDCTHTEFEAHELVHEPVSVQYHDRLGNDILRKL